MSTLSEETARELIRALNKVANLLLPKTEHWVKVTTIRRLTGWDRQKLRRARMNGEIKFKKDKTGIWYNQASLSDKFLISNNTASGVEKKDLFPG